MNLLLFFAFPISTIILAVVLEKILRNPILVALTFFAIYLIVTFAFFTSDFLINTIVYTILAYIAAVLTKIICKFIKQCMCNQDTESESDENNNQDDCTCNNACCSSCRNLCSNLQIGESTINYKDNKRIRAIRVF